MLNGFIVSVLSLFAFALANRASIMVNPAPRRTLTLVAVAMVGTMTGYFVYRHSFWEAAFSVLILLLISTTRFTKPIAAEALAEVLSTHLGEGTVLHLTVAPYGRLLVFRGWPNSLKTSTKAYRLLDQCPHCFLERQISALFDGPAAERVIELYRSKLRANRPVELQLTRRSAQLAKKPDVAAPGTPWLLNYFYPSNRTWRVPFPMACDVHNATALRRPPAPPGISG